MISVRTSGWSGYDHRVLGLPTEDNSEVGIVEPAYRALALLAVSVYPRVSNPARLACGKLRFMATVMKFRYVDTKEL